MEYFPIDCASLEKGQVIPTEEVETIYSVSREDQAFGFSLLRLKAHIEKARCDLVLRVTQNALRIMTDLEADAYLAKQADSCVSKLKRDAVRCQRIDRQDFTPGQVLMAESRQRRHQMLAMVTERARRDTRRSIADARNAQLLESGANLI